MLTADSLGQLKRAWLRPGGALVLNVVAFYTGPHVALARDVVRTLRSVFDHVRCFVDRPPHLSPDVPTNLVSEEVSILSSKQQVASSVEESKKGACAC